MLVAEQYSIIVTVRRFSLFQLQHFILISPVTMKHTSAAGALVSIYFNDIKRRNVMGFNRMFFRFFLCCYCGDVKASVWQILSALKKTLTMIWKRPLSLVQLLISGPGDSRRGRRDTCLTCGGETDSTSSNILSQSSVSVWKLGENHQNRTTQPDNAQLIKSAKSIWVIESVYWIFQEINNIMNVARSPTPLLSSVGMMSKTIV